MFRISTPPANWKALIASLTSSAAGPNASTICWSIAGVMTKSFLKAAKITAVFASVSSRIFWISASLGPGPRSLVVGAGVVVDGSTAVVLTVVVGAAVVAGAAVPTVPEGWGDDLVAQAARVTVSMQIPTDRHDMRGMVCVEMHYDKRSPHIF